MSPMRVTSGLICTNRRCCRRPKVTARELRFLFVKPLRQLEKAAVEGNSYFDVFHGLRPTQWHRQITSILSTYLRLSLASSCRPTKFVNSWFTSTRGWPPRLFQLVRHWPLVVQLFVILSIGTLALSGGRQGLVREEGLPAETILILQPSARRRVK